MAFTNQTKHSATMTNKKRSGGFGHAKFGLSVFGQGNISYSNQSKNTSTFTNKTKH